jgi:hypothetical protein
MRRVAVFALMTAIVLGACGKMRRGSAPAQEDVTIQVTNQGFPDIVMYVVQGTDPWRLGSVTGSSSARFKLPARMLGVGQLQLLARPLAGRAYFLPSVSVFPGDRVEVTLSNIPAQSFVTVAPR